MEFVIVEFPFRKTITIADHTLDVLPLWTALWSTSQVVKSSV